MKSRWLIEQRMVEEDDPQVLAALRWVLESPECPLCNHPSHREIELAVFKGATSTTYLEAKYGWIVGIVEEHMSHHIDYDPSEAAEVEVLRQESISTLEMAQDVFSRINTWLDEWEAKKGEEGISREWIAEATKLVGQANSSLKLIGTLKKEIGVDSQLMLAQQRVHGVMGILVDVLRNEPEFLNAIEIRLSALKAPPTIDADYEVIE
tara:strand:+ start:9092 stop:9715 length:624 start_codon:yes stop_codon:yes gene_type:complete